MEEIKLTTYEMALTLGMGMTALALLGVLTFS